MSQTIDTWVISAPELIFGFDGQDIAAPPPTVAEARAAATPSGPPPELPVSELMLQFESVGHDCEFGMVQRHAGVEPLGLFRFSSEAIDELLAVLETRFETLKDPNAVEIYVAPENREYMSRLNPHGFVLHTRIYEGQADPEVLRRKEVRRIGFLVDKLIRDLEEGEKILVRKGGNESEAQAHQLLDALQRYGPNTLLRVTLADTAHKPGSVEVIRPHLFHGYISRFWDLQPRLDLNLPEWFDLCSAAYQFWKTGAPVGARIDAPVRRASPNLIGADGWRREHGAGAAICPRPLRDGEAVTTHVLATKNDFPNGVVWSKFVEGGVTPDQIFTASAWVFVPAGFRGTNAAMVFQGFPSLYLQDANLKIRDRWQQIWASARVPQGAKGLHPGLMVIGEPGDFIYSTAWKLEEGPAPTVDREATVGTGV